ncbi:flavin reductase family protein [Streptomyces sp. NPDC059909]|uniref:flavin reductase family protein n=1 Tax=Streptomyces sp. NPDC059909 TaxID=3346998 RepID=UPI003650800E
MIESGNTLGDLLGDDDVGADAAQWALETKADPDTFRAAMGRVVGSVTVVTTRHDGRAWGMTVSAFSPVCMEPPMVLVCVNARTVTAADIHRESRFGVNLLSQDQLPVSQLCSRAGAVKYVDDHVVASSQLPAEVTSPVLRNSLVTFDCEVTETRTVGSHLVVMGQVRAVLAPDSRRPLLYGQGRYQRSVDIEELLTMTEAVA